MTAVKQYEHQPVQQGTGEPSMVSMIERVVMDPNIPLERLERMLQLKERMEDRQREDEDRQAERAFHAAMSECQGKLQVVKLTKENKHTQSRYADLAAISKAAMPIINENGFSVSFQPDGLSDNGALRIRWSIAHVGGHTKSGTAEIPIDAAGAQGRANKNATQAFGSTATYGRRYLLCMLFNIATGDDTDGNAPESAPEKISSDQLKELQDLVDRSGADTEWMCNHYKVEALPELTVKQFHHAALGLKQRLAAMAKQKGTGND